jgi:chaperonin GroES
MKPLDNWVILKREAKVLEKKVTDEITLFFPEIKIGKNKVCNVVAAGPGEYSAVAKKNLPLLIKEGDKVILHELDGADTKVLNDNVVAVRYPDILGIVKNGKVTPLGDRIVVEKDEKEAKIGMIIIPDAAREPADTGKVVAVGKGRQTPKGKFIKTEAKKGDKVLMQICAGTEVEHAGKKCYIVDMYHVFGVFTN